MGIHHLRTVNRNSTHIPGESFLSAEAQSTQQLKQYWLSRAVLFCNGLPIFLANHFRNDEILEFLGLAENTLEDLKKPEIKKILKNHCVSLTATNSPRHGNIFDNLHKVAQHFALNAVEEEIMLFALMLDLDSFFSGCFDLFGELTNRSLFSYLDRILDIPEKQITDALQSSNLLSNSGLLKVPTNSRSFDQKFDVLNGLSNSLDGLQPDINSIFSNYIVVAPAPILAPVHYSHIKSDYERISSYLKNVCDKKITGANILIYGSPGTGKTQLVRVLSSQLNMTLSEISVEDQKSEVLSSKERLAACQLAQKVLAVRTQEQCNNFIKNVTTKGREDLVPLIFQRSLELSIQDYANDSPLEDVEIECLKVLFLYEKQLALKNGKRHLATYTRRSIKNNGIVKAVDNIVSKKAETVGFKNLCSVGLTHDLFEVVVDKFPEKFSSLAVEKSRQRLNLAAQ